MFLLDTATTLKHLIALGNKAWPDAEGWNKTIVPIDALFKQAWDKLKKRQPNPANFAIQFITASIFGKGHGGHFEKPDNDLLAGYSGIELYRTRGAGR